MRYENVAFLFHNCFQITETKGSRHETTMRLLTFSRITVTVSHSR